MKHRFATFFKKQCNYLHNFRIKLSGNSLFSVMISNNASTVARTTVSCLNIAPTRVLLQGPPDLGIATCLRLVGEGGVPFLIIFQSTHSDQQTSQNISTRSQTTLKKTPLHNTRDLNFASSYGTLWPLSLPRRTKRCSRTAPKKQHLFEPQKETA